MSRHKPPSPPATRVVSRKPFPASGNASAVSRGPVVFLADLFVLPGQQSAGLGSALLRRVLPREGALRCTASSGDPRAQALYIRWGMRPRDCCGKAFAGRSGFRRT